MKAMIVNRVGDMGLILGMLAILYTYNTLDYSTIFSTTYKLTDKTLIFMNMEIHALTLISILLFIGAVGKSAQLGLHT
jgi:NADH:ubiquinone oxidoreductase subunit 5 (subunit L)/multisubunit Na+/H+ antiporter MnhA subunit